MEAVKIGVLALATVGALLYTQKRKTCILRLGNRHVSVTNAHLIHSRNLDVLSLQNVSAQQAVKMINTFPEMMFCFFVGNHGTMLHNHDDLAELINKDISLMAIMWNPHKVQFARSFCVGGLACIWFQHLESKQFFLFAASCAPNTRETRFKVKKNLLGAEAFFSVGLRNLQKEHKDVYEALVGAKEWTLARNV